MPFDFNSLDHEFFMHEALKEAKLALDAGEIPIGAVIVHNGAIVGRGRARHRERQSEIAHAEMNALLECEQYCHAFANDDGVLYTTVEPCVMCLGAAVMSDLNHIVFALPDRHMMPAPMLDMPFVRRHIKNYLGCVLEQESVSLWERANPRERKYLLGY